MARGAQIAPAPSRNSCAKRPQRGSLSQRRPEAGAIRFGWVIAKRLQNPEQAHWLASANRSWQPGIVRRVRQYGDQLAGADRRIAST